MYHMKPLVIFCAGAAAMVYGLFAHMLFDDAISIARAQPTNLMPFQQTINVGTTAMMAAVRANPSRKALMVCNNGPAGSVVNITFGPGTTSAPNTPTATTGVPLPGGAVTNSCLSLFPYLGPNISMGAQLNFIASAAGTPVTVLEF